MDFDGVFTDPSHEGDVCSKHFRDKIISLGLSEAGLDTEAAVDSWLGELRARQASKPFHYGWRSEGRISAFTFEDPFIRNIGLADFMDGLAGDGDLRAKKVLSRLKSSEKISSFGELSEWAFHKLHLKKAPDPSAKAWVGEALDRGHEVVIVSNSASDKIHEFLDQVGFSKDRRPQVRGGAKKFGLGHEPRQIEVGSHGSETVRVDTDRPFYEQALLELKPDAVIGDVFCLDLSLPVRLKREKKLEFKWGIFYRHRDYTPTPMVELVTGRQTRVPEVRLVREWTQVWPS
jgi:hypothetical protein